MKLVKNIIFTILAFCITSNAFAQELSDKEIGLDVVKIVTRLKERGIDDSKIIEKEVATVREMYKKTYIELQKKEKEISNEIRRKAVKKVSQKNIASRTILDIPTSERLVLEAIYNETDGDNWTNSVQNKGKWDFGQPVTSWNPTTQTGWYGITLNAEGRIAFLNLQSNGLNGIMPNLEGLTEATYISFNGNYGLTGNINCFSTLTNLNYVDINSCKFTGDLQSLMNLINLEVFNAAINNIGGAFPSNFHLLNKLRILNLWVNQIEGDYSVLGQIPTLTELVLSWNNFNIIGSTDYNNKSIPTSFSNLSNLKVLRLERHGLKNNINVIENLTNLEELRLSYNMFEGLLPTNYSNFSRMKILDLNDNKFSSILPDFTSFSSLIALSIYNNKFRFIDFANQFSFLRSRIFDYAPQAKIDTPITIAKSVGQQAILKMCMDDRFHPGDTYQWFKDGLAISGATSREFTIPAVALTDAGTYTCKSYHTSDPDMSPLILEREPIILNVLNCSPFVGSIVSYDLPEGQDYTCGNRSTFAYLDFDGSTYPSLNLDWTFLSPTGQVLGTYSTNSVADDSATFNFTIPGNNTIQLVVTEPNGCVTTLREIVTVTNCNNSCTLNNPNSQIVKELYINLANHLLTKMITEGSIPNGYNPQELINLAPYITDPNPRIYNAHWSNLSSEDLIFSFADHGNQEYDVSIRNRHSLLANMDLSLYASSDVMSFFDMTFLDGVTELKQKIRHINFCPQEIVNCTKTNPNSVIVNKLFVKLVQKLIQLKISGATDASMNGISIPELTALAPFITDSNPGIYNFTSNSNLSAIKFSFSRDEREYDVLFNGWQNAFVNANDYQIDLSNYTSSSNYLEIASNTFNAITIKQIRVRHINFCPNEIINCTKINPRTQTVKNLFGALITKLFTLNPSTITNGFTCPELVALAPYITDTNPAIYNYTVGSGRVKFSFAQHNNQDLQDIEIDTDTSNLINMGQMTDVDVSSYSSPEIQLDRVAGYFANGFGKMYIKHINFCPNEIKYCTTTNPRTARVKELFGKLITHLKSLTSVPDGYNCDELDLLSHYITDKDASIYNFVAEPLSFSFHKSAEGDTVKHDVLISNWGNTSGALISDIDVTYFSDANVFTNVDEKITFSDGSKAKKAEVRHINFCPEDICVNHVALVIDESGSIDVYEKAKIKRQLKWFLKQQADVNDYYQGNMYISIIGMADRDSYNRGDHIESRKITNATLPTFINWVDSYGNRYGQPGISGGSDFWKSGLDTALSFNTPERKLNMVIMITDGSQTQNPDALKTTMLQFNNSSSHSGITDTTKPHLYIVGINNGFYVGDNQTNVGLKQSEDPNYVPILRSSSPNSRVTPALSLSLKYLLNLQNAEFPYSDILDFEKDYYGHNDFTFIGDELNEFYFSNKIKKAGISCRKETGKDSCEDCFSFQPTPNKWYVLNAWAKEELNIQVQKYTNPKIKLHFYDINENEIINTDPTDSYNIYPSVLGVKGEIIEGWQRIGDKFRVPSDAVYMEVELINEGDNVPVYFDDIRIYPMLGSMKSFVYDPETFKLMSELDENNYATYYEYDNEGGLVRIKKETVKGVKTIQETRSGNVIKE